MSKAPNIVLIVADQLRPDYLGCTGHPIVQTPNIDKLAGAGTRFDRFYVGAPLCMSNRASLMTGRLPSEHGVRHNGIPLPLMSTTFVELLRRRGYRTALIGKSHLQNMYEGDRRLPRPQPRSGYSDPDPEVIEALGPRLTGWEYENETAARWSQGPDFAVIPNFYGFDTVRFCYLHGDSVGGHHYHWVKSRGVDPESLSGPDNAQPAGDRCPQAWRTSLPPELYSTSYVADTTTDFFRDRETDGQPFFVQVSFPDPHHPFTPPDKYWAMYDPAEMPLSPSFATGDTTGSPRAAWVHRNRGPGNAQRERAAAAIGATEREVRVGSALYAGMISFMDDAIGQITRVLAETRLDRNTIVIFTSDHGELMGDQGLMFKGPFHYQSVIRVPFIWCEPGAGVQTGADQRLASTIDIAPTILDRVGIEGFEGIQGQSLLPRLTRAAEESGPDAVLVEDENQSIAFGNRQPTRARTVVTARWRMSVFREGEGELFDLQEDPYEMTNRWSDATHAVTRAEMMEKMVELHLRLAAGSPTPTGLA